MSDGQSHGARDGYTPRGPITITPPNPPPGGTGVSRCIDGKLTAHQSRDWQSLYYEMLIAIMEIEDIPSGVRTQIRKRHQAMIHPSSITVTTSRRDPSSVPPSPEPLF